MLMCCRTFLQNCFSFLSIIIIMIYFTEQLQLQCIYKYVGITALLHIFHVLAIMNVNIIVSMSGLIDNMMACSGKPT